MDKEYSVKNVKAWDTHDGGGFTATLYRGPKRIALVIDHGMGGCLEYEWLDREGSKIEAELHARYGPVKSTYVRRMTPEENALREYAAAQPPEISELFPEGLDVDEDQVVAGLADDYLTYQHLKRHCRKKTLFATKDTPEGEYQTILHEYCPEVRAFLEEKFGDDLVEIVNERL